MLNAAMAKKSLSIRNLNDSSRRTYAVFRLDWCLSMLVLFCMVLEMPAAIIASSLLQLDLQMWAEEYHVLV